MVASFRQFWSRRHLNRELQGRSLSAANLLSHAVADILLISNYRELQTATGMEITINQVEACYSGGLGSSRVKSHYFYRGPYQNTKLVASLVWRQKQLLVYTLLSHCYKQDQESWALYTDFSLLPEQKLPRSGTVHRNQCAQERRRSRKFWFSLFCSPLSISLHLEIPTKYFSAFHYLFH